MGAVKLAATATLTSAAAALSVKRQPERRHQKDLKRDCDRVSLDVGEMKSDTSMRLKGFRARPER
jgi:hypothetical protein